MVRLQQRRALWGRRGSTRGRCGSWTPARAREWCLKQRAGASQQCTGSMLAGRNAAPSSRQHPPVHTPGAGERGCWRRRRWAPPRGSGCHAPAHTRARRHLSKEPAQSSRLACVFPTTSASTHLGGRGGGVGLQYERHRAGGMRGGHGGAAHDRLRRVAGYASRHDGGPRGLQQVPQVFRCSAGLMTSLAPRYRRR